MAKLPVLSSQRHDSFLANFRLLMNRCLLRASHISSLCSQRRERIFWKRIHPTFLQTLEGSSFSRWSREMKEPAEAHPSLSNSWSDAEFSWRDAIHGLASSLWRSESLHKQQQVGRKVPAVLFVVLQLQLYFQAFASNRFHNHMPIACIKIVRIGPGSRSWGTPLVPAFYSSVLHWACFLAVLP